MTAAESYNQKVISIRRLRVQLEIHLAKHANEQEQDPGNWGYVGDLGRIEQKLNELLNNPTT